jgi:hypothetical protein
MMMVMKKEKRYVHGKGLVRSVGDEWIDHAERPSTLLPQVECDQPLVDADLRCRDGPPEPIVLAKLVQRSSKSKSSMWPGRR